MRLTALSLEKYGNFERLDLPLDPAPGRLNLLMAPNGAGKSVLRQAFADLLFGIGGQSPMGFRFGYPGMRLSADAIGPNGTLRFTRRKGQGNTLLDEAGRSLPQAALAPLIGTADRSLLERLFALDTIRLREGGDELLRAQGALGDALVSAAGGVRAARRVRDDLATARDALAPKRKSAGRPFYKALDALTDAQRVLARETVQPEAWLRQDALRADLLRKQAEANAALDSVAARIARLHRIRRIRPLLALHDAASRWLAANPDAPLLPPDLADRLPRAREMLQRAEDTLARADLALRDLTAQRDTHQPDPALLAHADAVKALVQEWGAVRKAEADLPPREAERQAARRRIEAILRELGHGADHAQAAALAPALALRREARQLLATHRSLAEPLKRLPALVADLEATRAELAGQLAALPEAEDTDALAALVTEIRGDGDPGAQTVRAATSLADLQAAAATALARVPGWTAGITALAALAPAPLTSYERLDAGREAAVRREAEIARSLGERQAALAESQRARVSLGQGGALPDPAAIRSARANRDAGWALVYRIAFTDDPPSAAEIQGWSADQPLPLAYLQSVADADRLADRRMLEADRLATAAALTRTIAEQEEAERAARDAATAARGMSAAALGAWTTSTEPLGLDTPGIQDVRDFLARRDVAVRTATEADAADRSHAAVIARHVAWAHRLARALAAPFGDLPALLAEAEAALRRAQKQTNERNIVVERVGQNAEQLRKASRDLALGESALADWDAAWDSLRQRLGRPREEPPAITGEMLDQFEQLDREMREESRLAERIDGMQAEIARFAERAAALSSRLAPDSDEREAAETARLMQSRLEASQRAAAARQQADKQVSAARREAAAAREALEAAHTNLAAIIAAAGGVDAESAAARIALAVERSAHVATRAEAADRLAIEGDGLAPETLRAEAAEMGPDDLQAAIEAAEKERTRLTQAAQESAGEAARIAAEMRQLAAGESALAASAAAAAATADLAQVLDEALLMHVASEMLAAGLARVEAESGSALLARIGTVVTTLTCGAYSDVTLRENDNGVPLLRLAERGVVEEPKLLEQLSEGTRDQLYLALRLVAIEDYAATAPALPFIADDVLQTFDDARALAAMQALMAFSSTAQVIVLTHHRHLLEVAARLPAGTVNVLQIA